MVFLKSITPQNRYLGHLGAHLVGRHATHHTIRRLHLSLPGWGRGGSLSVGTPLCPYGIAYRRACGLSTDGLCKRHVTGAHALPDGPGPLSGSVPGVLTDVVHPDLHQTPWELACDMPPIILFAAFICACLVGERGVSFIRKHDHFMPSREIEHHVRALAHNHPEGWKS